MSCLPVRKSKQRLVIYVNVDSEKMCKYIHVSDFCFLIVLFLSSLKKNTACICIQAMAQINSLYLGHIGTPLAPLSCMVS